MWKRKEGMEGRMGKKIPKVNGRADGKKNTKSDPLDHRKSKRIPEKKIYFCFIDYTNGEYLKIWKYQTTLPAA